MLLLRVPDLFFAEIVECSAKSSCRIFKILFLFFAFLKLWTLLYRRREVIVDGFNI